MVDPVQFETWMQQHFAGGGEMDSSPKSRGLQETMVEAVMSPEVMILSRAVAETSVDEIHARMAFALVYAFERSGC